MKKLSKSNKKFTKTVSAYGCWCSCTCTGTSAANNAAGQHSSNSWDNRIQQMSQPLNK